jgi:hypothetical protein
MDPSWSETGDRYMLKLFRDYIFHAVDENGAPWMDMSHILLCLNKVRLLCDKFFSFSTQSFHESKNAGMYFDKRIK